MPLVIEAGAHHLQLAMAALLFPAFHSDTSYQTPGAFQALTTAGAFARRVCVIWAIMAPGRSRVAEMPPGCCFFKDVS